MLQSYNRGTLIQNTRHLLRSASFHRTPIFALQSPKSTSTPTSASASKPGSPADAPTLKDVVKSAIKQPIPITKARIPPGTAVYRPFKQNQQATAVKVKETPATRSPSIARMEQGSALLTRGTQENVVIRKHFYYEMSVARIEKPVLFVCDVQEKFRGAIWEFGKVISTTQKMVKAAKILNIPIYLTTQNAARLGSTVSEITDLLPSPPDSATEIDKTAFSMLVPDLLASLRQHTGPDPTHPLPLSVILVGIETHICVTQTTIDLLKLGHKVYVLADGVSSCNELERPIALARLAREGARVTTSESLLFELLGDAKNENFRAVSGLVRETKEETRETVATLGKL